MTATAATPNTVKVSAEKTGGRLAPAQDRLAVRFQLQYADDEAFVRGYAGNVSAAGMFVAADEPPPPGTRLYFAVLLADERCVLGGDGEVVWVAAKSAAARPAEAANGAAVTETGGALHGFGLRFIRLDARSVELLRQVLAYKAAHPERFFTAPADPYAAHGTAPIGLAIATNPAPAAPASLSGESRRSAPGPAAVGSLADEEAELKSLLRPALPAPPSAGDTARRLDDLLRRRPL